MRAYVIGNAVVDETFLVEALPVEGESIHATPRSRDVGGKGANQAIVLARAGVDVTLIAGLGEDARAETVRAALAHEPMDVRFVTVPTAATDMSVVMTTPDGGNAIITTNQCAEALDAPTILPVLAEAVPGDVMVLQGNLGAVTTTELFETAHKKGMPVVFNPSPVRAEFAQLLPRAAMVFVNKMEAQAYDLPTRPHGAEPTPANLGKTPATTFIITTMGKDGAVFQRYKDEEGDVHLPAKPCTVIDATGAGDTYQSALLAALFRKGRSWLSFNEQDIRAAGYVGAAAAAISISRHGTLSALPQHDELASFLGSQAKPAL